ncbi:hypothetical protein MA16_Dca010989 [Dendrobium catenatum]|uniref:FAD-binding domain-containing protein n=1 Tax=Dendrobium catenatum TaxID=906689 RepID=A0A2I0WCA1_9ASPA|nr:hypothetical protein MA16_Dca010989 [Dendrobium catenatum]
MKSMAMNVSSALFFSPFLVPTRRDPRLRAFNPTASSSSISRKEDVVIVGGGIAGLATALSLHRLGVPSLVLEQGDSLRAGGTSLTLFKNGWRVLDAIGVGDELRIRFIEIEGCVQPCDEISGWERTPVVLI